MLSNLVRSSDLILYDFAASLNKDWETRHTAAIKFAVNAETVVFIY